MEKNQYVLSKLTRLTSLIYLVGVLTCAYIAYNMISKVMLEQNQNMLEGALQSRATAVEDYFSINQEQVGYLAQNEMIVRALKEFSNAYTNLETDLAIDVSLGSPAYNELISYYTNDYQNHFTNYSELPSDFNSIEGYLPTSNSGRLAQWVYMVRNPSPIGFKNELFMSSFLSEYEESHREFHPKFNEFLEAFHFYDIFLLDTTGDLIYSTFKEIDFGTNFLIGPHASSGLGRAYRGALAANYQSVTMTDFENYLPSYLEPAAFLSAPVFDGGEKIGAVVFQLDPNKINALVSDLHGLGSTGEAYIVGEDLLMRSDSRFSINSTILRQEVATVPAVNSTKGLSGSMMGMDYRGIEVLSHYRPLKISGLNWGVIAEVDKAVIMAPALKLAWYTIGIFVTTLALIALISFATLNLCIIRPLVELLLTAKKFRDGDYTARVYLTAKDEFAILGESHNKMAESIQNHIGHLKSALDEVKELRGLLPICSSCKSIRGDDGYFRSIESYLVGRSNIEFTHTVCLECMPRLYPELSDS